MVFRIDEFSEFPSGPGFVSGERARFLSVGFGAEFGFSFRLRPTSQDAIRQILLALIEEVEDPVTGLPLDTVPSGFWSLDEIVDYLNERQSRFITDTGICLKRQTSGIQAGVAMRIDEFSRFPSGVGFILSERTRFLSVGFGLGTEVQTEWNYPDDWLVTYRVNWANVTGSSGRRELPRGDSWELDHGDRDWQSTQQTFPTVYIDVERPPRTFEVAPSAVDILGFPEVLYAGTGDALTTGADNFAIPDEFVPALKWGVISDMLSKPGRGFDPERSDYAERRYQEGVVAARLLVRGWS